MTKLKFDAIDHFGLVLSLLDDPVPYLPDVRRGIRYFGVLKTTRLEIVAALYHGLFPFLILSYSRPSLHKNQGEGHARPSMCSYNKYMDHTHHLTTSANSIEMVTSKSDAMGGNAESGMLPIPCSHLTTVVLSTPAASAMADCVSFFLSRRALICAPIRFFPLKVWEFLIVGSISAFISRLKVTCQHFFLQAIFKARV